MKLDRNSGNALAVLHLHVPGKMVRNHNTIELCIQNEKTSADNPRLYSTTNRCSNFSQVKLSDFALFDPLAESRKSCYFSLKNNPSVIVMSVYDMNCRSKLADKLWLISHLIRLTHNSAV